MQKFVTNLWYNDNAKEAVDFYVSVFEDSKIVRSLTYNQEGAEIAGKKEGGVMAIDFQLGGQDFTAINGGPSFKLSEAASIVVNCKDQAEIDRLWETLSKGGQKQPCGWLKDRYGLSWQIIPESWFKMIDTLSPEKLAKVLDAMYKMEKMIIKDLEDAAK